MEELAREIDAAIWLVQALAGLGRGGAAFALWETLNPVTHADAPGKVSCVT